VLELAERLWRGEVTTDEHHPVTQPQGFADLGGGTAFVASLGNVCALDTDDGLMLVDTGNEHAARQNHDILRRWSPHRLHTAVYTHGHIDHVFGVPVFEEEAEAEGVAPTPGRRP
jgi:glyoxylase-like metal-dependent hydrolase (beta-lactamase superfamily II)